MPRSVLIELQPAVTKLMENAIAKLPSSGGIGWVAWAPVGATIVTAGVAAFVQYWLSNRNLAGQMAIAEKNLNGQLENQLALAKESFANQMAIEEDKRRSAAIRVYLESCYRGVVALVDAVESATGLARRNAAVNPTATEAVWRATRHLRMQTDFANIQELSTLFSEIDNERRKLNDQVTAWAIATKARAPKMAFGSSEHREMPSLVEPDLEPFAKKCDAMQNRLRERLSRLA